MRRLLFGFAKLFIGIIWDLSLVLPIALYTKARLIIIRKSVSYWLPLTVPCQPLILVRLLAELTEMMLGLYPIVSS